MLRLFTLMANTLLCKGSTSIHHQKGFKVTTGKALELRHNSSSPPKTSFPLWHITMPLYLVIVTSLGPLTAYSIAASSITEGRYTFDFSLSREQVRIRTDINKQAIPPQKEDKTGDKQEETIPLVLDPY